MNKKSIQALVTSILLLLILKVNGQIIEHQFGKITMEEAEMAFYKDDPEATAVVLYDKGESKFREVEEGNYSTFHIFFTRTRRIKIFRNEAYNLANIDIPYYTDGFGKTEKVTNIRATSLNYEDGQLLRTDLDTKQVLTEKSNEYWSSKKFAIPNVKEGTIIEYSYQLETPFKYRLPDWEFQSTIPTLYSEYEARLIPFFSYVFIAQGITKFDYQKSELDKGSTRSYFGSEFQDYVSNYVMKDVPAFKDESYISSINDYIIKLDFQLQKSYSLDGSVVEHSTTWPKLNNSLLKNDYFGKYLNSCTKLAEKNIIANLKESATGDMERLKSIIDHVKHNYSWNGNYSKYTSQKAKDMFRNKIGNSADVNLLLLATLIASGYEAYPVILSTRDHGKIKLDYPFSHFFNYVVVMIKVNDKYTLTDATDILLSFDKIPANCLNDRGLIVQKDGESWVKLNDDGRSSINEKFFIELDLENEFIKIQIQEESSGYDARRNRRVYLDDVQNIVEEFAKKGFENVTVLNSENYQKPELPYKFSLSCQYPLETFGDIIVISPFLNLPMSENLLKQKERKYPVDMVYKRLRNYHSVLTIPDGYELSSVPEKYFVDTDQILISLESKVEENTVTTIGSIHFKKSTFATSEYSALKFYFSKIVKLFNDKIVLKKKAS